TTNHKKAIKKKGDSLNMKRRMTRFLFLAFTVPGLALLLMLPQFFRQSVASASGQEEAARIHRIRGLDNYDIRLDNTKEAHMALEKFERRQAEREQEQRGGKADNQLSRARRRAQQDGGSLEQSMAAAEAKLASRFPGLETTYSDVLSAPEV